MAGVCRAIRSERQVRMTYRDFGGKQSERTVWPFALAFFDDARVMAAWCELRRPYRHFRTDRIVTISILEQRYPRRPQALLKAWRESQGIPEQ